MDLVGFRSGDVVAVRKGGDARNGDVVVARIGEEITLKRYGRQNGCGSIELQPVSSDSDHGTIRVDGQDDFEISGVVVGAIIGTRRE
jgi:repressor LexA